MKQYVLTASANIGMGLWTMICVGFSHIFGVESKRLQAKQTKVLKLAKSRLVREYTNYGSDITISDFRTVWNGQLSVTVSALVTKESKKCPKCGEAIDDDDLFCGVCGQKLK